jgi:hypothetical protein
VHRLEDPVAALDPQIVGPQQRRTPIGDPHSTVITY